jgi:NCAIR mutase (PurE)-related protein
LETEKLKRLLEQVQSGQVGVDSALGELRNLPYENLDGFATLDHHRVLRNGFPEVIFGQGKQPDQIVAIARRLLNAIQRWVTRGVRGANLCRPLSQYGLSTDTPALVLDKSQTTKSIPQPSCLRTADSLCRKRQDGRIDE